MFAERIIQLSGRSRAVMACALMLILLYAIYGWTLAPHVKYARAVNQFGAAVEDIQRETSTLEEALLVEQNRLETIQCRFSEMQTVLFDYEEAKDFLGEFEGWARACECSLSTVYVDGKRPISVLPDEREGLIEAIEAEVTVIGSMAQVGSFIRRLQDHPRYVSIESLQLIATHRPDRAMRCRIALRVYVLHA